jgi:hypothetical protein
LAGEPFNFDFWRDDIAFLLTATIDDDDARR